MRDRIVIGTRGSALARAQTGQVAEAITRITGIPVETVIIKTRGDRIQDVPLHQVEGKGFFTKELEEALLDRRIDLAVHSLKDLPTESPAGLVIAAIPAREPANDLLLVRDGAGYETPEAFLSRDAVVGTSSKRRALQITALYPQVSIKELRGNVPTRIAKLVEGRYDAILVAAAGFRRLGITAEGYTVITLDFDAMLPAPGQGALALQTRSDDGELSALLEPLHDTKTAEAVEAERRLLDLLGGGCGMPLGVYAERSGPDLTVRAVLGPDHWQLHDSPTCVRAQGSGRTAAEAAKHALDALKAQQGT